MALNPNANANPSMTLQSMITKKVPYNMEKRKFATYQSSTTPDNDKKKLTSKKDYSMVWKAAMI